MAVDFQELKSRTSIEEVARLLKLELKPANKQLRGVCPACDSGNNRTLAITPERGVFFCFADNKGGDLLSLAAHINKSSVKEAAEWIHNSLTLPQKMETTPTSNNQEVPDHPFTKIAKGLQYDHEVLALQGISPEEAEAVSMGYKKSGLLRGMVIVPLRDDKGNVLRCIGLTPAQFAEIEIGKEFAAEGNVVSFPKKTA